MATQTLMTAEQFDQLPEDEIRRFELIKGELVEVSSPRPKHSRILLRLVARLESLLNTSKLGVLLSETDLALENDTRVRPNAMIYRIAQYARVDENVIPVREMPAAVIEILSPGDVIERLDEKTRAYLDAGIEEVWIINPNFQELWVRKSSGVQVFDATQTFGTPILPGWTLKIADLFQ